MTQYTLLNAIHFQHNNTQDMQHFANAISALLKFSYSIVTCLVCYLRPLSNIQQVETSKVRLCFETCHHFFQLLTNNTQLSFVMYFFRLMATDFTKQNIVNTSGAGAHLFLATNKIFYSLDDFCT